MTDDNQVAAAESVEEVIELEVEADPQDDPELVKAELAAERAKSKQILARAHAAESKLKSQRASPAPDDIEEYVDLRAQGYDRDDIAFIRKNGGTAALKDENSIVAIALAAKREKQDALSNAQKVGGSSPTSEVERKFSPEELAAMSSDDLYKILPKTPNE